MFVERKPKINEINRTTGLVVYVNVADLPITASGESRAVTTVCIIPFGQQDPNSGWHCVSEFGHRALLQDTVTPRLDGEAFFKTIKKRNGPFPLLASIATYEVRQGDEVVETFQRLVHGQ